MPFKSDKQRKLMYAVANNPAVAKKTGIRKEVADKFIEHKAQGGSMKKTFRKDEDSAAYKAKERKHVAAMEKHGVPKNIIAEEKREAGLKKGGKVGYADGGPVMPRRPMPAAPAASAPMARRAPPADAAVSPAMAARMAQMLKEKRDREANTRAYDKAMPNPEYKKGGCVKKYAGGGRVDGCATKGKTRGRMV